MTSAREIALAAASKATPGRGGMEGRKSDARYDRARQTIDSSPLGDWFPGVEWVVISVSRDGGDCVVRSDDHLPVVIGLRYDLAPDGTTWAPPRCYMKRVDEPEVEVRSAADVGRVLGA